MKCPVCGWPDTKVTDSRSTEDDLKVRRRRECTRCGYRFTTYEVIESSPLMVLKRDGSRQPFDREKLLRGLMRACNKRSLSMQKLDAMVDQLEQPLRDAGCREVTAQHLGELVLKKLKKLDQVAYIRFASVYRDFQDADSFVRELERLREEPPEED